MNTSKKIISLLMCMLMVLTMVPMSVFATVQPIEIDTINIEGVPAPLYGQTVKEYNTVMYNGSMDGTHKINGSTRVNNGEDVFYGNIELSDWEYYNSEKSYIAPSSADALPSVYYLVHWLYPAAGYKFPDGVAVTVDGSVSVETELDEDGCLAVWAKFEVKPTEIDTVNLTYDLDYIDLNNFYNENSVTVRAREALATDTAGIKIGYGNCCVSYIDSHGDFYNCTYPSKEIIAEKDYYIRAVLMLEDGYDWPTATKTDEPSGLKIISNGTDISDTVYIKYRSDLNWIIVYAKIGKPSTEPVISGVSISDSAIMLDKGESHSFIVDVYGNADDKTVTWTVEGAASTNTTVDNMGKLTIGADETADEITVKATSNYNGKKFVTAKVKIGTPTEIDTVHIEGVPAPVYGQTIKSYYEAIEAKITDGTITVNDEVYDSTAYKYGNLFDDGWNVRSEADGYLSSTSTDLIKEGTYYVAMWFYPDIGYVIPEDVNVLFDGAKSVKIEVEDDGCLDIRAEYEFEAPAPTEIDAIHIEGIPAPLYGQTPKDYLDDVIAKVKVNNEPYDSKNQAFGNLNVEWEAIFDSTKTNSLLSSSEILTAGTYYYLLELYPKTGFVFADIDDISASVNGNASVELEASTVYDDTVLVWVKFEVKCPHAYDNACDAECNICKAPRTPAAHKGGTATCTTKAKCSVCGEAYGSLKAHSYKTVTTKATLTKNGKTESKCSCGAVKSGSTKTVYYPKTFTLSTTAYTYNGKTKTPTVTVKDYKGNTLKKDTDYTVSYESGRKYPGEYTVKITFKGKYEGTKRLYFTIAPKATSKITATQTTTTITLKWNKVTGADGYRVYKYNSKTKKYEYYKSTTSTSMKISKLKEGTAYKYKVRAYTKDDGTIWGAYSGAFETATKCKTPSITKLTTTKGKASYTWSNVAGESGYQVYYSSKKDSGYKKVASYKTNVVKGSKTKLKSGKKYYFKVRAYKKTASGTVYSAWSSVKSVKVK